jgi:hypothetical protein
VASEVRRGLGPTGDLELGEDRRDVVLHRLLREAQLVADLLVRATIGHQGEDALLLR